MPLFQKSQELLQTIRTICDLIHDENLHLREVKAQLLENSAVIQVKIAGAESARLWDLKMENAAIIRKCARELLVSYHSLQIFGFEEAEYYRVVRRQLEEFRLLFREWVANFNPKHYIVDDWGLFNPPGIPQDYVQRSDELDFLDEDDFNYFDDEE